MNPERDELPDIHNNGTLPWGEADWEREFAREDVRAARYAELFETLVNHPERDLLIAREMGWHDVAEMLEHAAAEASDDEDDSDPFAPDDASDDEDDPFAEVENPFGEVSEDEFLARMEADEAEYFALVDEEIERERNGEPTPFDPSDAMASGAVQESNALAGNPHDDLISPDQAAHLRHERGRELFKLEAIPAFIAARELLKRLHQSAQARSQSDENSARLASATSSAMQIIAKIANGHGLGYEPETRCGNIVRVRQAQGYAESCAQTLELLRDARAIPADEARTLLILAETARRCCVERAKELRRDVWWD